MTAKPPTDENGNDDRKSIGTRVCIKNIPINFTKEKLIHHLQSSSSSSSKQLVVTDCKLLYTKEGKFRKLAFVGLKESAMAKFCVNHFHKSYAGTSKLIVEYAFQKQDHYDPDVHRPWSKHSEGSSRNTALLKSKEKKNDEDLPKDEFNAKQKEKKIKIDKKKEEFLAAMGAGTKKSSFWSNDDGLVTQNDEEDESDDDSTASSTSSSSSAEEDSDSDEENNITVNNDEDDDMAFLRSKATAKEDLQSDSEAEDETNDDSKDSEDESDSDSSSVVSSSSDDSDSSSDKDSVSANENEKGKKQTSSNSKNNNITSIKQRKYTPAFQSSQQEENPALFSPTRLFIRNLSFQTTEDELKEYLETYGTILECHIPIDDRKKRKGYAFVRFATRESAMEAKNSLDRTDFQGRLIHVMQAKKAPHETEADKKAENPESNDNQDGAQSRTYKSQKEQERQHNAPNDSTGWNTSILRTDAIVDNLSSRLDMNKSDILASDSTTLTKGSNTAAVRLALGETHILQENREYFAKYGFDMEGLITMTKVGQRDNRKRSSTQILVKNLPYNSNQEELLHKLLADHRTEPPKRILIPPSKTVALFDYEHPTEARTVFRKLAYKRFQHVPLYLEWAPLAALKPKDPNTAKEDSKNTSQIHASNPLMDQKEEEDDNDTDLNSSTSNQSIFVKNLNFKTTEDNLLQHFTSSGISVRAVKIPTKVTPSNKRLSMGYGFVECSSSTDAQKALRKLKQTMLDGHSLQLSVSSKQLSPAISSSNLKNKRKKLPKKIAIKNIPFQASKSEITSLFGTFGKIKNFRLPKKFGSAQHRGFGFLEFISGEDAGNAMESLSRTHLYGRKLVLEWAEAGPDEEESKNPFMVNMPKAKKIRFSD